jgi:hypothetical protein
MPNCPDHTPNTDLYLSPSHSHSTHLLPTTTCSPDHHLSTQPPLVHPTTTCPPNHHLFTRPPAPAPSRWRAACGLAAAGGSLVMKPFLAATGAGGAGSQVGEDAGKTMSNAMGLADHQRWGCREQKLVAHDAGGTRRPRHTVTAAMDFFRRPPPGLESFSDAPLSDGLRQKDRGGSGRPAQHATSSGPGRWRGLLWRVHDASRRLVPQAAGAVYDTASPAPLLWMTKRSWQLVPAS